MNVTGIIKETVDYECGAAVLYDAVMLYLFQLVAVISVE